MMDMMFGASSLLGPGLSLYPPLLAQVNIGSPQAVFLGLMIAGSGAGLYFLRSFRPELARDHDIFFAAIGLLCGGIIFFNGWRLDPILLFAQILLGGSAVFFAVESIRLRGIATNQARRNTPIVDDERPVGRVYRAELDELRPSEDAPPVPRIRSARESDDREEGDYYGDRYSSEARYASEDSRSARRSSRSRRPRSSRRSAEGFEQSEPRRSRRRPATESYGSSNRYNSSDSDNSSDDYSTDETPRRRRSSRQGSDIDADRRRRAGVATADEQGEVRSSRRRRSRAPRSESRSQADDYVDYRPVDYPSRSRQGYDNASDDEWA